MSMSARRHRAAPAILALLGALAGPAAHAADGPATQEAKREIIPGSELMTHGERERYRQRIRGARSPQEESAVREGHLHMVRERARLRGLRLPEPGPAGEGSR